ncbi:MAG: hypothetical protein IKX00_03005 [Bacilli bacterium]|nr:hypothetical protein [Bacilli bacterium]
MKKKYLIIIVIIALLIAFLTIFIINKKKDKNLGNSKIVVMDDLSINFLNGDEIYTSSSKDKEYIFSITNNSTVEKYYVIKINDFKANASVKYKLSSDDVKINIDEADFQSSSIVDYAVINPGDTHTYSLILNKYPSKYKVGTLSIEKYTFEQQYFAQTIIANSNVSQDPKTTVGMEISQTDEGLIQDLDDDGVTYYFRGNVQNNYVKFADMLWRIVRINGNGTVRLVLDSPTDETAEYYTSTSNNYFAYSNTNIKSYLNNWYQSNLSSLDKYIATTKVCDDTAYTGKDEYIFAVSQRLSINHNPTFNCLGTKINTKISLLTADEIEYAGALIGVGNNSYYLYNSNIVNPVWTMSPSKGNQNEFYPYTISTSGSLDDQSVGSQKKSVRPVINIRKDLSVDGKGTITEPYELLF